MAFEITPQLLASGHKYRRELLALPVASIDETIRHMTPRYGVQGKETAGTGVNGAQLRPYRSEKGATDTSGIETREIETFLGDVVEEFDPHALWSTIYASTVGTKPDEWEIARQMAMLMAMSVGEHLADSIFTAKRNASGSTTMDLFNGFETIIETEKTAGKVAEAKGNLIPVGEINLSNVVDTLKRAYRASHERLRQTATKMFLPWDIYDLYCDGYKIETGGTPYNDRYEKTVLEGSDGKCELVPMGGMSHSRILISPKSNMLVGLDQTGTRETVEIRRADNPKVVQFFMASYFGVEYQSIDPRLLNVVEYTQNAPAPESEPGV